MRLTRKQTQEQTRERLLDAAEAAILEGGLGAVSLRGTCAAAGYSQGAFYSNFANRDALLLALMERHIRAETTSLAHLTQAMQGPALDDDLARLGDWLAVRVAASPWTRLNAELKLHAQRDTGFAARYRDAVAAYHARFAAMIRHLATRHGLRPALTPEALSQGLYALWSGLSLNAALDPGQDRVALSLAFFRAMLGADGAEASFNGKEPS